MEVSVIDADLLVLPPIRAVMVARRDIDQMCSRVRRVCQTFSDRGRLYNLSHHGSHTSGGGYHEFDLMVCVCFSANATDCRGGKVPGGPPEQLVVRGFELEPHFRLNNVFTAHGVRIDRLACICGGPRVRLIAFATLPLVRS